MKDKTIGKGIATIAAAACCALSIYCTNGETGIGWFLLCVFFIWQ